MSLKLTPSFKLNKRKHTDPKMIESGRDRAELLYFHHFIQIEMPHLTSSQTVGYFGDRAKMLNYLASVCSYSAFSLYINGTMRMIIITLLRADFSLCPFTF